MSAEITTDVARAAQALRSGRLVAFATETVYGLGADALDPLAVARVFEAKGRPRFDPLIVHVASTAELDPLLAEFPERARQLADAFWPGPLTLVLPKRPIVPDLVTAGLPRVAVRIPGHPQALELLRAAGRPIAAPSANLFGRISPTTAEHVAEQLGDRIDLILDGGPCRVGVESTVLDLSGERPTILRPGGVTAEELTAVLGVQPRLWSAGSQPDDAGPSPAIAAAAPGMLPQHYAPRTPLELVDDLDGVPPDRTTAVLAFDATPASGFLRVELLSPTGDLRAAAAGFFAALRRLDASGARQIIAQRFPDTGLGCALNDRLARAAARP